jgi:luciferase family oxidoreductase group 1
VSSTTSVPLSILDLAPVPSGSTVGDALRNSIDLVGRVEALGYNRYWVAEHHNMPGIASSPAVLLAHLAMVTSTIRLGSGGVMLPNHAPLAIAEQFGMLEAVHSGRIDLGLGRAPGTDQLTARALRVSRGFPGVTPGGDDFPQRFAELRAFFEGTFPDDHPYARIQAVPGLGNQPAYWLLGSSDFGAQMAGQLGLPFTFAHHFATGGTDIALDAYRSSFEVSPTLSRPYSMIGVSVVCAESESHAQFLAGASALGFLWLRMGRPSRMPTPEEARDYPYSVQERAFVEQRLRSAVIGTPDQVKEQLEELVRVYSVDELMITTAVHSHADRVRSFELLADVWGLTPRQPKRLEPSTLHSVA